LIEQPELALRPVLALAMMDQIHLLMRRLTAKMRDGLHDSTLDQSTLYQDVSLTELNAMLEIEDPDVIAISEHQQPFHLSV